MDKKTLRQQGRLSAKTAKDQFGPVYDKKIETRFFETQRFARQTIISAFMTLKGEVSCGAIIRKLGQMGCITCLPVVLDHDSAMIFREYGMSDSTKAGLLGQEPLDSAAEVVPDVLIVPMLGFNRQGYRLGYGVGFYDRTLSELRASKKIKAIGLAYSAQEMPDLKPEPHDMPMDVIITEKELIQIS